MDTKTVLIVDDEAAIRDMLRVALEMANFRCIEAKNAYEAQVSIVDDLPDLVLLDWMMPEVTGIELLRRWRRNPDTKRIPVIMLTAKAEERSDGFLYRTQSQFFGPQRPTNAGQPCFV